MSDCEQIAQVAYVKNVTVSDSLRSLMIKERMSKLLIRSFAHKKERFAPTNLTKIVFLCVFIWQVFKKPSVSLIPSFFKERCEGIAQVAHDKRATVSKSLRALTKNERP